MAKKKTTDFGVKVNMKKKLFGIKIGTYISVIVSLAFAVLFWLLVKYAEADATAALALFSLG